MQTREYHNKQHRMHSNLSATEQLKPGITYQTTYVEAVVYNLITLHCFKTKFKLMLTLKTE